MKEEWIDYALKVAELSTVEKNKVGCVITDKKGRVLSVGFNSSTKTHPMQKKFAIKSGQSFREFLHAEIQALVRCDGNPHTLYVARITQAGRVGMSKPCPVCEMALREAGVVKVVYTASNGTSNEYYVNSTCEMRTANA